MTTKRMTIKEITEATGTSGKTLRAYLRRNATRQAEAKGSRWGTAKEGYSLTAKLTQELLDRFTPEPETEDEE